MIYNETMSGGIVASGTASVRLGGGFLCRSNNAESTINSLYVFARNKGRFYGSNHNDWRGKGNQSRAGAIIPSIVICRQNLKSPLTVERIVRAKNPIITTANYRYTSSGSFSINGNSACILYYNPNGVIVGGSCNVTTTYNPQTNDFTVFLLQEEGSSIVLEDFETFLCCEESNADYPRIGGSADFYKYSNEESFGGMLVIGEESTVQGIYNVDPIYIVLVQENGDELLYENDDPIVLYGEETSTSIICSGESENTCVFYEEGTGGIIVSSSQQTIFEDLMDGSPLNGTLLSAAIYNPSDQFVLLTPAINGFNGQIEYSTSILNGNSIWFAEWEFRVWGGSGADAVYFYFYNTNTPSVERDQLAYGYSAFYSEYLGYASVYYSDIIFENPSSYTFNDSWRKATVSYANGLIRMYLDNVLLGTFDYPGHEDGTKIGLGARTGGLNNNHAVRNFKIYV